MRAKNLFSIVLLQESAVGSACFSKLKQDRPFILNWLMINARVFNVYNDILPDNCNHHRKPEAVDSDEEVNKMGHDDAAMGADVV